MAVYLATRQYKLIDLDYGFTYPKFLDLEKTFIFLFLTQKFGNFWSKKEVMSL